MCDLNFLKLMQNDNGSDNEPEILKERAENNVLDISNTKHHSICDYSGYSNSSSVKKGRNFKNSI